MNSVFLNTVLELTHIRFLINSSGKIKKGNSLNFNWGIIWDSLKPLVMVAGLATLFSLGIRGQGRELEYLVFLIMFWLSFSSMVTPIGRQDIQPFVKNKRFVNTWSITFSIFFHQLVPFFIRFLVCLFVMTLFDYKLPIYELFWCFILLSIFGLSYGTLISAIFRDNNFFHEAHTFFLAALFFLSSVIFPVPLMPEAIRDILLYNPLVHLFEWVKSPVTGIVYEYINLNYFLNSLLSLSIFCPISIQIRQIFSQKNE